MSSPMRKYLLEAQKDNYQKNAVLKEVEYLISHARSLLADVANCDEQAYDRFELGMKLRNLFWYI